MEEQICREEYGHSDCVELLIENKAQGKRVEDVRLVSKAMKVRQRKVSECLFFLSGFLDIGNLHYSTQEEFAEAQKLTEASREDAKRCDYPECNASAADKNMERLKKCPRCGEGRYCCQQHCNLDWDRHKLLCKDIKLKVEIEAQF